MKKSESVLILLLIIFGIVLIINYLKLPADTYLWREIHNTGHTPLFGLLSLVLLQLSSIVLGVYVKKRYQHYFIAFFAAILTGAFFELLQIFGTGDADFGDIVRDILGATSFLGFYATIDKKMMEGLSNFGNKGKFVLRYGSFLLLLLAFVPAIIWIGSYIHRNSIFPKILDFESIWETKFINTRDAVFKKDRFLRHWEKNAGDHVGSLTFFPAVYPTFCIEEPYPDWSNHNYLCFEIYSELERTVRLTIRVEDFEHDLTYADRFNHPLQVEPGLNHYKIPLDDIRNAPVSRHMDMTAIRAIHIFASRPADKFTVYIDNIYLE